MRGRALVAAKVKDLVIEDGFFQTGGPPVHQREGIDVAATQFIVGTNGWPRTRSPGPTGTRDRTKSVPASVPRAPEEPDAHRLRETLQLRPTGRRRWDGPTMLYAVGAQPGIFSQLGQGGARSSTARVVRLGSGMGRPPEVYLHVADQTGLNARINALIESS